MPKTINQNYIAVEDARRWDFCQVDNGVLESENIDKHAKLVYVMLCKFANQTTKECFPSLKTLSKLCCCSVPMVTKALKQLEKAGHIEKKRRQAEGSGNISNLYLVKGVNNPTKHSLQGLINIVNNPTKHSLHERYSFNDTNINDMSQTKDRFDDDHPAKELALYLKEWIFKNNNNHSEIDNAQLNKWASVIDKMNRLDNRDWDEIRQVIDYCQSDSFWWKNILSANKLRKQYDQLTANMIADGKYKEEKHDMWM